MGRIIMGRVIMGKVISHFIGFRLVENISLVVGRHHDSRCRTIALWFYTLVNGQRLKYKTITLHFAATITGERL
jgi:hypothetical protein